MTQEMSNEEIAGQALLAELDKEHEGKRAAVLDMLEHQKAERQAALEQLQVEQDRLEKLAAQRRAQEALDAYTVEWRKKFATQAEATQQWVTQTQAHLQALERAGAEQELHRRRAQALLTEWAQGVATFTNAFDNPAQLQSWAVEKAKELTADVAWGLPVSAEVRRTFRVTSANWQSYGTPDVRRDVVVRALRRPMAPATLVEKAPEATIPPPSELVAVTPDTSVEDEETAQKRAKRNARDRARRAAQKKLSDR